MDQMLMVNAFLSATFAGVSFYVGKSFTFIVRSIKQKDYNKAWVQFLLTVFCCGAMTMVMWPLLFSNVIAMLIVLFASYGCSCINEMLSRTEVRPEK